MKHHKICIKKGQWQNEYQVLWKGYEEPTWEPSKNLEHSKELITDYWNRQRQEEPLIASIVLPHNPETSRK